jgi:hypothetical protein
MYVNKDHLPTTAGIFFTLSSIFALCSSNTKLLAVPSNNAVFSAYSLSLNSLPRKPQFFLSILYSSFLQMNCLSDECLLWLFKALPKGWLMW